MTHLKTNKTDYKKFLIKLLSATLVVLMLIPLFVACSDKPDNNNGGDDTNGTNNNNTVTDEYLIRECVETFLTAYNEGDMDAVLECLDAKSRNAMEAMLNLLGGVAGSYTGFDIDLKDLFSLGVSTVDDDFMLLNIISVEMRGSSEAVVTTSMSLHGGMNDEKIYFIMVYEKGQWCISDITDKKGGVSNNNQDAGDGVTVTELIYQHIGNDVFTYVVFNKENKEYAGVLNTDGEIFYYIEGDYINYVWAGKDTVFTKEYVDADIDYYHYDIINENGEIVATSRNGDFDTVIGYGDDLVLVYKNTSTISKEEHSYGVINATTGNWDRALKAGTKLTGESFKHIGDGIFLCGSTMFNSISDKVYYIENCAVFGDNLENGFLLGKNIGGWLTWGTISSSDDPDTYIDLPEYFELYPDGTFKEIDEFSMSNEKIIISEISDGDDEYYKITDCKTGESTTYKEFNRDSIYSIEIYGEYILMLINGADGNKYLNVTNSSGERQFEPIKIASGSNNAPVYSCERIVYKKPNSEYCEMIDMQGNLVISSVEKYSEIAIFGTNGVAYATNSEGETVVMSLDGKPISIKLTD